MPESFQMSFRVDYETREAFKAKLKAEGSDISKFLNKFVRQYIAGNATPEFNSTTAHGNAAEVSTAAPSSLLGNPQNVHRIDSLERAVISMSNAATLANQIAQLEIHLTNAIKLLEYQLISTNRPYEVTDAQKPHFQSIFTGISNIEAQLVEIKEKLANDVNNWQQPQAPDHEQTVAKLLANINDTTTQQLAKQSEQISELERKLTEQQVEYKEQLTQVEARITPYIEECRFQITTLGQSINNSQKQKDLELVASPTTSTSPQEDKFIDKPFVNETSKIQASKTIAKTSRTAATEPASSAQPGQKTKDVKQEKGQPPASPTPLTDNGYVLTDDGYVVIDGVRKKLLLPKEAHEVAKKHGFNKDSKAFGKLSPSPLDPKLYRPYGLGIIPELRGASGVRKAWYYEL